jgi:hypothetical protein
VRSAGVQRQYSGTAGRTENCQIGVFLGYATGRGRTLIDRRLYLPTSWTDDRERCRRAGIADEIAFETKVAMAKAMVRRAIAENIPFRWVTADAAYGYSKGWRHELEQADVFHVMATTGTTPSSPAGRSTTPSTTCSTICPARSGNAGPAGTAPTDHASSTGPASKSGPGTGPTAGTGSSPAAASAGPRRSPTTSPTAPPAPHSTN